jgi:hypothetical protein
MIPLLKRDRGDAINREQARESIRFRKPVDIYFQHCNAM